MVYPANTRHVRTAPAPSRFDALCMALGLPDRCSPPACRVEAQAPKLRTPPAGGVRKVRQRQTKFAAAAVAADATLAAPPRLADQPRCRQPFALGRPPRPMPTAQRLLHAPQQAQRGPRAAGSCDSVTSPNNVCTSDCSAHSGCVMSPAPLPTGAGSGAAILATGMRLILASMSPSDACQLAAARTFLAAFPPAE